MAVLWPGPGRPTTGRLLALASMVAFAGLIGFILLGESSIQPLSSSGYLKTSGLHVFQPNPPLSSRTVAAIIENRPLSNLVPLILHFSTVLGPTWAIHVFHTAANAALFTTSPPFQRLVAAGQIVLTELGPDVQFANHDQVSAFLTGAWFWEQLAPAEHVLLFQADSVLCANSRHTIDEFLDYDFVGAPIDPHYGQGYNGGLSLRNRARVLQAITTYNWTDTRGFEDQWFFEKMTALGANLPSQEVASRFAVETIWAEGSLGVHQIRRWQGPHLEELEAWCPEYKLADDGKLFKDLMGG